MIVKSKKFLVFLSVFLTACTSIPHNTIGELLPADDPIFVKRKMNVKKITHYKLSGVVGVLTPEQSLSLRLFFHNRSEREYQLSLLHAVTGKHLNIERNAKALIVQEGEVNYYITDLVGFLTTELGANYPIDEIGNWLKGYPSGEIIDLKIDSEHHLRQFVYQGQGELWTVDYLKFNDDHLPILMTISNEDGTRRLKIKVNSWKLL